MTNSDVLVRSLWESTRIDGATAPYDTAHLKIYYPAINTDTVELRMSGVFPGDTTQGPRPVVVFMAGVNIGMDTYRWLMIEFVKAGYIGVTFDYVGQLFPGLYGITPGIDLERVKPESFGSAPPSVAIQPVLDKLVELNAGEGPLAGMLDLDKLVIGGHSGGGTAAMISGRKSYFPGLKAVVSYAAHTVPADVLGWEKGTVLQAGVDAPILHMGGTADNIMRASAVRYSEDPATRVDPILRTFDQGIPGGRNDAFFVEWEGANHFAMGDEDVTAARGFLEGPGTADLATTRRDLVEVITNFLNAYVLNDSLAAEALDKFEANPPATVTTVRRK